MLDVKCGVPHYGPLSRRIMYEWRTLEDPYPVIEMDK